MCSNPKTNDGKEGENKKQQTKNMDPQTARNNSVIKVLENEKKKLTVIKNKQCPLRMHQFKL